MKYRTELNGCFYDVDIHDLSKSNCRIEFFYKGKKYIINQMLLDNMDSKVFDACIKSLLGSEIASIDSFDESYSVAQKIASQYGLKIVENFPD